MVGFLREWWEVVEGRCADEVDVQAGLAYVGFRLATIKFLVRMSPL